MRIPNLYLPYYYHSIGFKCYRQTKFYDYFFAYRSSDAFVTGTYDFYYSRDGFDNILFTCRESYILVFYHIRELK